MRGRDKGLLTWCNFIAKYNFYRTSTNDLRKAIFQIATCAQDDLQNRFTWHKLKKASVIPHLV